MNDTLIQGATRRSQQRYQDEQGKLGAFAGTVKAVTPNADELTMSYGPTPGRAMPVQHPFVSQNSWIRSMPEIGTVFLMTNRFDSGQPEALKTIPAFSKDRADEYLRGLNIYRAVQPGEHDIVSSGFASAYFSRRGNLDLRSGASVKVQLSRENLDLMTQAPTHRAQFLYWQAGTMGDEARTGIVKRWTSASDETFIKKNDQFVSESYLHLKNPNQAGGPVALLRKIEGQVFDDEGAEIKHTTTALPLRSQSLWYTTTDEFLKLEIDENGNLLYDFPSTATTGWEMQIPEGSFRQVIGKDRDVTIDKDDRAVVQENIDYTVGQNVTYNVTKNVTWNSGEGTPNTLFMDAENGAVQLTNKDNSYGFIATNAGGGSTKMVGPQDSGLTFSSNGSGVLNSVQSLMLKVDQIMNMEGTTLNMNFSTVNIGKAAYVPAVMGLALQTLFDSHFHTSSAPGSPTSPPTIPSVTFNGTPQSITSIKIMLAGNT